MNTVPGQDIFLKRSELNVAANGLLAILAAGASIAAGGQVFWALDGRFAGSTLISQAAVIMSGQALVAQMILRRAALGARWGERAFSVAFRWLAIPGLALILAGVAHFAWIEGARIVPREIALVPCLYLLITGIVLWLRAIWVFGVDNLSLMYVYFPSEGRLVQSNIYSILRHPVYSAVLRIAFALVLWNGSPFALFAGIMAPLAMTLWWLRRVEEPELIERFGDGYREYRARVPAFFNLNPRTWPAVWRFLATGQ